MAEVYRKVLAEFEAAYSFCSVSFRNPATDYCKRIVEIKVINFSTLIGRSAHGRCIKNLKYKTFGNTWYEQIHC